jgi:hypothetical protein
MNTTQPGHGETTSLSRVRVCARTATRTVATLNPDTGRANPDRNPDTLPDGVRGNPTRTRWEATVTRIPAVIPCSCDLCSALSRAIDAHRTAITEGRDKEPTRRAVRHAAAEVDHWHSLDEQMLKANLPKPTGDLGDFHP